MTIEGLISWLLRSTLVRSSQAVPPEGTLLYGDKEYLVLIRSVGASLYLYLDMACPFCRMPTGPCPPFDASPDRFTVLLDRRCSRRVYVPRNVRAHLAQYIEHCRGLAIRRGDKDTQLALHTNEGELYGVLFSHGVLSSKFHGPAWEGLVTDYGLCSGDTMTVRLEHYGTLLGVDFYRGEDLLFPLPCVALQGLSESERDLVGTCFYTRGVNLSYRQLYSMSRQLFNDNYILCRPFVHKISSYKVNRHHMIIPNIVVMSLNKFVMVPSSDFLTLEVTLDYYEDDVFESIPSSYFIGLGGRMVFNKEGFSGFLQASSMEENTLVLITFKERDGMLVVIFSILPQ